MPERWYHRFRHFTILTLSNAHTEQETDTLLFQNVEYYAIMGRLHGHMHVIDTNV